ncbi:MAG: phosphotransferase [Anaerolineae bacterium]
MLAGHAAVRTTPQIAAQLAQRLYGITAVVHPLPGEYDDNFHLTTSSGSSFVLKVMHPDQPRSLVELQCAVLQHLAEHAPQLTLPRVQMTLNNETIATINSEDDSQRLVWMLTYIEGQLLVKANPNAPQLLYSLGQMLGQMNAALSHFDHPAARRELKWDLARSAWIRDVLHHIDDPVRRALVEGHLNIFETEVLPELLKQRQSIIHNDANDYNVLVSAAQTQPRQAVSVIDFGDTLYTQTVSEVVIAATYALLDKADPLSAAASVIAGYHAAYPLTEAEIALIFPLICTRLSVSVANSAQRKASEPDDPYLVISERPAWDALEKLATVHPRKAHYLFRSACGFAPVPHTPSVINWLRTNSVNAAPLLDVDVRTEPTIALDLSVGSLLLGANPANMQCTKMDELIFREMRQAGVKVSVGGYDEARMIYQSDAFATGEHPTAEHRTIHLGLDLWAEAGMGIYAPLAGKVYLFANNAAPLDYGPLIILKHETGGGETFYTLYGHLSTDSLDGLTVGQHIERGQRIASIGTPPTNGNWPPHLHFQIITDLLELDRDFPGVALASQRELWKSLSPDPNLLLGIPKDRFLSPGPAKADILRERRQRIGGNLSISYREPLNIVRGWMQYLWMDETGAYLDVYTVPLVGHSHPRVVQAVQQQMALLTFNTTRMTISCTMPND